jgi:hypothetical protein
LLVGNLVAFELRVLGAARELPVRAFARLSLVLAVTGFGLVALSGLTLFAAHPGEMLANRAFVLKMGLVMTAGVNAALFHARDGLNKLDAVARRTDMLPWLKSMQERHAFAEYVPMSARKAADVERLLTILQPYLPEQDWFHEEDALTDRSERFLVSELIREKLFRLTGDELPYTSTVVIDKFEEEGALRRIAATIVVERDAHKGMVIGEGGERLKRIGSEARQELEPLLDARVLVNRLIEEDSIEADILVDAARIRFGDEREERLAA